MNTRDTLSTFGSTLHEDAPFTRVEGVALEGVAATPREPPVVRGVMSAEKSPSRPDTDVPTPVASSASAAPVSEGASRSSPYSLILRAATSEARGLNALLNELRIQLDIAASGASGTPQPADAARDDSGRRRATARESARETAAIGVARAIIRRIFFASGESTTAIANRLAMEKCAFSRCENVLSKKRLFLAFDTLTAVRCRFSPRQSRVSSDSAARLTAER